MSKKKRIKELERRLALLEAEVAGLRAQRGTFYIQPQPWTPQITCTVGGEHSAALSAAMKKASRDIRLAMN